MVYIGKAWVGMGRAWVGKGRTWGVYGESIEWVWREHEVEMG